MSAFEVGVFAQLLLLADTAWKSKGHALNSDRGLKLLDLSGQFHEDEPDDAEERKEKDASMLAFRVAGKSALQTVASALTKRGSIEEVVLHGHYCMSLPELRAWKQSQRVVDLQDRCSKSYTHI